jgi:hypothetical protein
MLKYIMRISYVKILYYIFFFVKIKTLTNHLKTKDSYKNKNNNIIIIFIFMSYHN